MVLVTFRFLGLAHLHTPWGCFAFVGFPSGFGLVCLGLCPLGFLFAVLVAFSLGCLHIWCGLGALASRRHGVVCSRWAFASVFMACFRGGLLWLLLWLPPSLCAVYLGAVQIKVRTDLVLAAGVLSLRHRKSATERIPSLLTGLVRLVLDPVLRASSGSLAQGSAGSAWFVEPPKWSIAPSTFSFYSQVIIYSFETSGDLQHFYSTVYPSSAPRIATMLVEQRSTENMPH